MLQHSKKKPKADDPNEAFRRFVALTTLVALYAGRVFIIVAFATNIWMVSVRSAMIFLIFWTGVFLLESFRKNLTIGGLLWVFDDLARITLVNATIFAVFHVVFGAVLFLGVSLLYLSGLLSAQFIQSKVLHPENAGYDGKESAIIRQHALFFLMPRQSVRFSRTCYAISRSGLLWIPLLLIKGVVLWPVWLFLYVSAGALSSILDPAPLLKGALRDSPHDMALREQVLTLERIITRIVGRKENDGQRR